MSENKPVPVTQPTKQELQQVARRSLNDCLAVERTVMANERTLLAYIRTALGILVVSVTVVKLFTSQGMTILGYAGLVFGIICLTVGLMRFTDMMHKLNELETCRKKRELDDEDN